MMETSTKKKKVKEKHISNKEYNPLNEKRQHSYARRTEYGHG